MEIKNWLNIIENFKNNENAIIICPICEVGILKFTDIAFDNNNIEKGGERYIECPNCNALKIVLYRIPPENWYKKNNK